MAREVLFRGHRVFCPHKMTALWEDQFDIETILDLDFDFLDNWADSLFYMGPSAGADRELARAEENHHAIYRRMEDLPIVTGSPAYGWVVDYDRL